MAVQLKLMVMLSWHLAVLSLCCQQLSTHRWAAVGAQPCPPLWVSEGLSAAEAHALSIFAPNGVTLALLGACLCSVSPVLSLTQHVNMTCDMLLLELVVWSP